MRPVSPQVTPHCAWRTQSPAWVPAQAQTAPCPPPTHTPQSNLGSTCPAWGGNSALNSCADSQQINIKDAACRGFSEEEVQTDTKPLQTHPGCSTGLPFPHVPQLRALWPSEELQEHK